MTVTERSTLSRRRKRPADDEPLQLFRPSSKSLDTSLALLNRVAITEQDVVAFLHGLPVPEEDIQPLVNNDSLKEAYNARRDQIREWASQVESGTTEIDEHMRLIPTPRPQPPAAQLPPPPVVGNAGVNNAGDNDEDERRWLDREEREAAEAIARAVRRYRQAGVPEEDFVLVRVPQREQSTVNLTFRRICFAVLAVVTAFVCIMLQTLPLLHSVSTPNPVFDKLMWELLHVREFDAHAMHCNGLNRENSFSWIDRVLKRGPKLSCADGVLHIPADHVIHASYKRSPTQEYAEVLKPYVASGVNVTWFLPCQVPSDLGSISPCYPGVTSSRDTCARTCFRGVHDGVITRKEVDNTLKMGAQLVEGGGDHNEIHYDTSHLTYWIPTITSKLKELLRNQYNMEMALSPVAFRVSIALPMDGTGVPFHRSQSTNMLVRSINRTTYLDWLETTNHQNELASYSLPPLFATKSVRDACHLMADLDADPEFAVHTSVFLSDAAGGDYVGGAALYVDHHPSNRNPRYKIRRGVSIDGSVGRIVVSTGGDENRRCRLPTRAGVRGVLQIWWSCARVH